MNQTPRIRPATLDDADIIGDIYNHYIRNSEAIFQMEAEPLDYWQRWMNQFDETGPHRLLVADRGQVDGFAHSTRFHERAGYDQTVMTSIYLRPVATGEGLGKQLYVALFEALRDEPLHRAIAWIALPNDPSVALHKGFGFRKTGTMTEVGFKFDNYIDVLMMEKPL
ncbi:MAG: GNAT family N-acetyltransferase [Alphaproteobacteria bacterium]